MSELYQQLKKKQKEIQEVSLPLREEKAKLEAEAAPLRERIRELSKKIQEVEKPLGEISAALVPLEKQEAKRLKAKYPDWKKDGEGESQTLTKDDVGTLDATALIEGQETKPSGKT